MRTTGLLGTVDLPGATASVPLARAYVRGALLASGRRMADDVELLTGELVANAVNHSDSGRVPGGVVRVRLFDDGRTVRVEVTDAGPAVPLPPVPLQVDPLSENGRGLWLVRSLSSDWGWEAAGGLTVWFEWVP
ncbi:ATP-binding protein [Sphaerisporangium sp. B11E5]|uniref:ATP-binding protein n=1 Tax=Sphaerisporangium sp. B11E5 TaxID=3153563 RepID=UPI00325CF470